MGTQKAVDPRAVVQREPEVIFTRLDDELIALDTRSGIAHSLNTTGARVWELIETPASMESIWGRLGEIYDVDPATCREQVAMLLADLSRAGLVDLHEGDMR